MTPVKREPPSPHHEKTPTAKPAPAAAPVAAAAPTPPGAPYVAGTPIEVTAYRAPGGNASFFMVGDQLVGSEEDALMTLKNQLFLPPATT